MLNQEESRFFFCAKNLISPHKLALSSLHLGNRGDQEKMESSSAVIVVFFVFYVFLSVPKDVFFLTMFQILMQKYSLLLFNETAFFWIGNVFRNGFYCSYEKGISPERKLTH